MKDRVIKIIELIAGAILMISPWILGFSAYSVAAWTNLTIGGLLVILNVWLLFGGEEKNIAEPLQNKESKNNN
ncbi:SPW repeat protein [Patescibacteria group bacterium]|nr:SPW repeat protein [Patescibacteria group bacterium]